MSDNSLPVALQKTGTKAAKKAEKKAEKKTEKKAEKKAEKPKPNEDPARKAIRRDPHLQEKWSVNTIVNTKADDDKPVAQRIRKFWVDHWDLFPSAMRSNFHSAFSKLNSTKSNKRSPSNNNVWKHTITSCKDDLDWGVWIILRAAYYDPIIKSKDADDVSQRANFMKSELVKLIQQRYPGVNIFEASLPLQLDAPRPSDWPALGDTGGFRKTKTETKGRKTATTPASDSPDALTLKATKPARGSKATAEGVSTGSIFGDQRPYKPYREASGLDRRSKDTGSPKRKLTETGFSEDLDSAEETQIRQQEYIWGLLGHPQTEPGLIDGEMDNHLSTKDLRHPDFSTASTARPQKRRKLMYPPRYPDAQDPMTSSFNQEHEMYKLSLPTQLVASTHPTVDDFQPPSQCSTLTRTEPLVVEAHRVPGDIQSLTKSQEATAEATDPAAYRISDHDYQRVQSEVKAYIENMSMEHLVHQLKQNLDMPEEGRMVTKVTKEVTKEVFKELRNSFMDDLAEDVAETVKIDIGLHCDNITKQVKDILDAPTADGDSIIDQIVKDVESKMKLAQASLCDLNIKDFADTMQQSFDKAIRDAASKMAVIETKDILTNASTAAIQEVVKDYFESQVKDQITAHFVEEVEHAVSKALANAQSCGLMGPLSEDVTADKDDNGNYGLPISTRMNLLEHSLQMMLDDKVDDIEGVHQPPSPKLQASGTDQLSMQKMQKMQQELDALAERVQERDALAERVRELEALVERVQELEALAERVQERDALAEKFQELDPFERRFQEAETSSRQDTATQKKWYQLVTLSVVFLAAALVVTAIAIAMSISYAQTHVGPSTHCSHTTTE
ncbi:hypothetical protein F66182_82 [Fusarium sp. NRRL 66182]|nr:hypothetical protein F66182_82 [Fusarium sp. NRRL 66182]